MILVDEHFDAIMSPAIDYDTTYMTVSVVLCEFPSCPQLLCLLSLHDTILRNDNVRRLMKNLRVFPPKVCLDILPFRYDSVITVSRPSVIIFMY